MLQLWQNWSFRWCMCEVIHQATLNSSSSYYRCGKEDHLTRLRTNNNKIDQWSGESSIPILKKIAKQHSSELLLSKSSPLCELARFTKKKTPRFGKRNFIMSTPLKMKKKHGWIVDFHDDLLYNRANRCNSIGCSCRKIRKSPPPRRRGFGSNGYFRNICKAQYQYLWVMTTNCFKVLF